MGSNAEQNLVAHRPEDYPYEQLRKMSQLRKLLHYAIRINDAAKFRQVGCAGNLQK
jgi:hypothetical protein